MKSPSPPGLELHTFGSTNGHKVAIALEELGLAYDVHPVNVFADRANLQRWFDHVGARPAVRRGVTIPAPLPTFPPRRRP